MEFKKSATPRSARKRLRGQIKVEGTGLYGHCIQLYKFPPTDTITLDEFEELAVERLKGRSVSESVAVCFEHRASVQNVMFSY